MMTRRKTANLKALKDNPPTPMNTTVEVCDEWRQEQARHLVLWKACQDGDLGVVQRFIDEDSPDRPVNWNWIGPEKGDTPLHRACRLGRLDVIRKLLDEVPSLDVNRGNAGMASPFFIACQEGRTAAASMLIKDPRVDINAVQYGGNSTLVVSCYMGHRDIVSMLLADPRIDTTYERGRNSSALFMACVSGRDSTVSLLLDDGRFDINTETELEFTPLWIASRNGHLGTVKVLLASPHNINARHVPTGHGPPHVCAAGIAKFNSTRQPILNEAATDYERRRSSGPQISDLVNAYVNDPNGVRETLRRELGYPPFAPGGLFVLIVMHSDGYLKSTDRTTIGQDRFFRIVSRLPMEIQMIIANRAHGSVRDVIPSKITKPWFNTFARDPLP